MASAVAPLSRRVQVASRISRRTGASGSRGRSARTRATAPAEIADTGINFGPLDQYLGYYLRRLYHDYHREFVALGGDMDIQPREAGALFVIGLNAGLTPSQLSSASGLDGAQTTAMLNMFERRGLIERRVSGSDARSRMIYLTRGGRKFLDRLEQFIATFDRTFANGALSDSEMEQLIALLAKLHSRGVD